MKETYLERPQQPICKSDEIQWKEPKQLEDETGAIRFCWRALLIELDIVGQEACALFAEAGDFGRDGVPAVGGLVELLLQAAHGGALAAVALFAAGQFGADHGVLLDDGGRLAFELRSE